MRPSSILDELRNLNRQLDGPAAFSDATLRTLFIVTLNPKILRYVESRTNASWILGLRVLIKRVRRVASEKAAGPSNCRLRFLSSSRMDEGRIVEGAMKLVIRSWTSME